MVGPIKLDITENGEVQLSEKYVQDIAKEKDKENKKKLREDPENYVHTCFHGKKCRHLKIKQDPPRMICEKKEGPIILKEGCPLNLWERIKPLSNKSKYNTWEAQNKRLHYEDIAKRWEKSYGSTRKLPDSIVAGMQSLSSQ